MVEYCGAAYSRKLLESIFTRRLIRTRLLWPLPGKSPSDSQRKSRKVVVPVAISGVLETIGKMAIKTDPDHPCHLFLKRLRRNFTYELTPVRRKILNRDCVARALRVRCAHRSEIQNILL